jgi:hypothetical protein
MGDFSHECRQQVEFPQLSSSHLVVEWSRLEWQECSRVNQQRSSVSGMICGELASLIGCNIYPMLRVSVVVDVFDIFSRTTLLIDRVSFR